MAARRLRIEGRVQGVGFRPFVRRLADAMGLCGWVRNEGGGVLVHLQGEAAGLQAFGERLYAEAPALAHIASVSEMPAAPQKYHNFAIHESRTTAGGMPEITPDIATCPECRAEMAGIGRRHAYPFTSCSHCGPRFSIIRSLPYDRTRTSMAPFSLCPACGAEYADPDDSRYHAQPIACPACGPRYWLERDGARIEEGVIEQSAALIREGGILAIKGIGGFHLACDASNEAAVAELRRRKRRQHKPFALMASDLTMVRRYARVNDGEAASLSSPAAPVVVVPARAGAGVVENIAPGLSELGFMLPYTPLHELLLTLLERPIVLTSANQSGEPQCIDNDEAREGLAGIADAWLMHERAIIQRQDDSVLRFIDGAPRLIRRARGYVPESLRLPRGFDEVPPLLALGGDLKSSFCLSANGKAVLSAPLGDLQGLAVQRAQRHAVAEYRRLYGLQPKALVVDAHPDYHATRLGRELAQADGLSLIEVAHHHAHLAGVMLEHGVPIDTSPMLGICLDGIGLGADGTLWGGEFLRVDYRHCERLAHIDAVPLPGGERAMREPWRNLVAHLDQALGWPSVEACCGGQKGLDVIQGMLVAGINSPPASSAGRLFDAVAALLGVCRDSQDYEGEAAMCLEALAVPFMGDERLFDYGCEMGDDGVIRWAPLWRGLIKDSVAELGPGICAARFHHSLVAALARTAVALAHEGGYGQVLLSGGVMQNRLVLEGLSSALRSEGLEVLSPAVFPVNDGGLALGQVAVAAAIMRENELSQ